MVIPYRTRNVLKRLGVGILAVTVAAIAIWLCWLAWLDRFVVYTRDNGATLDFSQSSEHIRGQLAVKPEIENPISIYYNEGANAIDTQLDLEQIIGYYISGKDLETNLEAVRNQAKALPKGTPIMMDVKSIYGNFYYSSRVSDKRNSDLDIEKMDSLIQELNSLGYYTIARLPALRDYHYGLNNVQYGLPVAAGYLWMDDYGCYWLNPGSDGTVSYLAQIANELKQLGFREVVFFDYYVPDDRSIVFREEEAQVLAKTAQTLVNTCATDRFAVSFTARDYFQAPDGRSRIYLTDIPAAGAAAAAEKYGFENPDVRVVFMTDVHDTRFDAYSVLRPIADAQ